MGRRVHLDLRSIRHHRIRSDVHLLLQHGLDDGHMPRVGHHRGPPRRPHTDPVNPRGRRGQDLLALHHGEDGEEGAGRQGMARQVREDRTRLFREVIQVLAEACEGDPHRDRPGLRPRGIRRDDFGDLL